MRLYILLLFPIILFLSCETGNEKVIKQIQHMEYLRQADPEHFIPWLNSKEAEIRRQAVESLGRIQDTSTVSWVANRLIDDDNSTRSEAAFAMGQYFSPGAEESLLETLPKEKSDDIKGLILEALGKTGTEASSIFMRNYVESSNSSLQMRAAIASGILAYRGYPPYQATEGLSAFLRVVENPELSWRCAYGLFRMGSPSEFRVLVDALDNPNPLSRYFSLRAQGVIITYLKTPQAKKYQHSPTVQMVHDIISSSDYMNKLGAVLEDSSWYVRLAGLQLLEELTPEALFNAVKQRYTDDDAHIRSMSVQVIARYKNKAARQFLQEVVDSSPEWRIRGSALQQMARLDPRHALKIMPGFLDSLDWPENYYLIQALDLIESSTATSMLLALAESENRAQLSLVLESLVNRSDVPTSLFLSKIKLFDPVITTIVATKLGVLKDVQAVPDLIQSYYQFQAPRDAEPMLAILAALESIADTQAVGLLRNESKNSYPPIRQAARQALTKITGTEYEPDLSRDSIFTKTDFGQVKYPSHPRVRLETSRGEFILELYPQKAPVTIANFLKLVRQGFYENIYFHRVIPGFVIQAGDPRGDGWGGPGYTIPCEYNNIFFDRGVVGMAHAGKDTGGSQFFITHTPQPHLNGRHTAFGRVIAGMDVIDKIQIYDKIIKAEILN